jgi:hypothetical protein
VSEEGIIRAGPLAGGAPGDSGAQPAPAQAKENRPLVAHGLGGHLELTEDTLTIVKGGALAQLLDVLWIADGMMEKTIAVDAITSVEIVRALVLPDFIRVTYATSPPQTGHYLDDALAENALMMNLIDNRTFYEIRDRIIRLRTAAARRRTESETAKRLTADIS